MAEITEQLTHPLLPKLKEGEGNKMEGFAREGTWLTRPSTELDRLSDSISTEDVDFEVNSIPDMWSRPILFEMALFDEAHPIHQRVMGEWRGMLVMLALRNMRQFTDLAVKPVKIPKNPPGDAPAFVVALSRVMPEKVLAEDSSWDHLYIILFRGKPIGMTTPITLVCTSTDYFNLIHGVQWFGGRFLLDPIGFLNRDEKNAVAYWLEQLKLSIVNHPNLNNNLREFALMLSLLDDFIKDLGGVQEEFELGSSRLGIEHGIFQYLDRPLGGDIEGPRQVVSHVQILISREPTPSPALLVVDKDIARQWGRSEQEILVFGQIPLARIPNEGLSGARDRILGTPLENTKWCIQEDFFTEKLVLVQQKNAFPGMLPISGIDGLNFRKRQVTPIIPINDLILKYLNPQDIANRMRFEQIGGEEIRVYLNLPLTGISGSKKGEDFLIRKSYNFKKGDIIVQTVVPILEIWPNFVSPKWNIYYSYFSTTGEDKVIYASPFKQNDEKWEIQEFKSKSGKTEKEIIKMDRFPEAYECKSYWLDANKRLTATYAGLLLLQKPESIPPIPEKTTNIGIDFGTSGTNAYLQEGAALPDRIVFDEHFLKISDAPKLARAELYDYFFPPLKEEMPFLSIFHDFLLVPKGLRPLLDGHIYFPYDPKEFNAGDDKTKSDLKWGGEYERERAKTFLEQLCLMCAAEAARRGAQKISWRYAFPTVFSHSDEHAIRSNWDQISEKILRLTGIKVGAKNLLYRSESVASANYFSKSVDVQAAMPRGAVFIDIGGTTSDISIWGGSNQLLIQTSLRFAGRDIFSYPLWKKTEILDYFLKEEDLNALNRGEVKKNPTAFYAQLDAIVSAESENILNRLPNLNQEIKIKEFKQFIAIGISGLLYYIGLLIQQIPGREKVIETAPNIYWGGNGSRLLHWLAGGKFAMDSPQNHLLKGVFCKSSQIAPEHYFDIKVSPEPKAEVAYGLVLHQTPLQYDEDKVREGHYLAGETFADIKDNKHEWGEKLSTEKISAGIKLLSENGNFKMDRLQEFLQTFNVHADKSGILKVTENSRLLNETGDHVNHEFAELQNSKEEDIHIEPLFIVALKKLLNEVINAWAKY
jgi:hypothetical protein